MPIWDYECPRGHRFEAVASPDAEKIPCRRQRCKLEAERIFVSMRGVSKRLAKDENFREFTTTNIDGTPITIKSRSQLAALENKHGVTLYDDPHLVRDRGRWVRVSLKDAAHLRGDG